MKLVKDLTYNYLVSLIGKTINFQSDCDLFENFNVTGRLVSINLRENIEYIFNIKLSTGKEIKIGSNMKNLKLKIY